MGYVLLQALSFTLIIVLGIVLRKTGMLDEHAGQAVKKLLVNVTLPCAIVINFSKIESVGVDMLLLALMGILFNVMMIVVGMIVTKKSGKDKKALYMLSLPAYNIGAFCLPFVQSFLPAMGSVASCMFDVGNSIMCTGGTYAFVAEYLSEKKGGMDVKALCIRMVKSIPLMTYVVMFLLAVLGIRLPEGIQMLFRPMASANTFIAMLMIGLLFHMELKKSYITEMVKVLAIRHVFAALMAVICFFALPFSLVIRQTLVLLCFAPISAVAPAYVGMCDGDEGMASAVNSISIILSIVELTGLLLLLGIS